MTATPPLTGPISTPQARTGPMPTSGRWGWYRDHEGREFRRVSTLVKKVETDNFNLEQWKLRQVAEGLALRDDFVLAIKSMGRPSVDVGWSQADKAKLNGITKSAMEAAKQADGARRGTAYHDLTERLDRGEPLDVVVRGLPAGAAQMLRAYAYLRRENGWENVEIERTVVCDELEVAGTFDRVDLVPGLAALLGVGVCQYGHDHAATGHAAPELPVIVDVKSEKDPTMNGLHIGPQLASYSRARKMWKPTGGTHVLLDDKGEPKLDSQSREQHVANGEYVPAPCVRQDVAIVVHVTETAASPLLVNLAEGWEAAQAAYAQMNRESRARRKLGSAGCWFAELPGVAKPPATSLLVEQAMYAHHGQPDPTPAQLAAAPPTGVDDAVIRNGHVVQEAYRREDGMVDWRAVTPLDDVDRQAIDTIYAAAGLDDLARTYQIYTGTIGRTWAGPAAAAAEARRAMIECGQRALHVGGGKCACGWNPEFPG